MGIRFAGRTEGVTGSAIREIFKLLANPGIISFAGGAPAKESFPGDEIADIANRLIKSKPIEMLQYGISEGYSPLRETVASMLKERGIETAASGVAITTGSSQGIDIMAKIMLDPGDKVLVEAPTFLGALQSFKLMQAEIVPVSCDAGGLVVEELEEKVKRLKPKMLYTIPTFQNPGGMTLTLERRKKVAELAARYGFVVIEDDPYCDLRYEGERLPAIKSFDEAGMVVTLMSFSKIISPGLRVGAAVASDEIMKRFVVAKQSADTHTSVLSQAIVDEYVKSGALPQHISRICEDYATRMRAMLDMMKSGFPASCKYNVPQGGLFIWAELPEGVDTLELLKKSIEKNVAFIPGTHFYDGGGHLNTLRLNFSASGIEDIKKGMGILSEIMRETYL